MEGGFAVQTKFYDVSFNITSNELGSGGYHYGTLGELFSSTFEVGYPKTVGAKIKICQVLNKPYQYAYQMEAFEQYNLTLIFTNP